MRVVRRALGPVLVTVVLVAVLFVGVFPTRTYLAQRASTGAAQEKLEVLREQNELLEARTRQLHDHAEIERLARERYNLVRPGEEAYAVLPPPEAEAEASPQAPPPAVDDRNLLERAWDGLTGIF